MSEGQMCFIPALSYGPESCASLLSTTLVLQGAIIYCVSSKHNIKN